MKSLSVLFPLLNLFFATPVRAQNALQIMESVRQVAVLQGDQTLIGRIREGVRRIPLTLFLRNNNLQFALDGGAERFHLRLNAGGQDLFEIVNGKTQPFPPKKISQAIRGTDVSYEDLALKFLYWPNPKLIGKQKLNGQDCWRIHLVNPEKTGRYREVSVWVTMKQRALIRVVGYGPRPKVEPLKQFEITSVMKVNSLFTVKTMKVTSFEKKRVQGTTYIEFDKPKARPKAN